MSYMTTPARVRGATAVRADATSAKDIAAKLAKTFEDFKAAQDKRLEGIDKKFDDVVQAEQVERINGELSELSNMINEVKSLQAAMQVGSGGQNVDPDVQAHADQFNSWFRRGDRALSADLGDLEVKAKLTTQSDPDGGYLVPTDMENTIDRVLGAASAMRSAARVMPISSNTYKKLVSKGGAGSGWVGESEDRPETNTPQLAEIAINTKELYAQPASTQSALDDAAIDVAKWLADEVSIEFAEQEGAAFISGDGVNRPKGILGYPTVANSSHTWGKVGFVKTGAASSFASTNPADALVDLYYALKAGYRNGASWIISDVVQGEVRKMKDGQGNYLWAAPTESAPATFLGKPIMSDDNMPGLAANKFPVAFGNWKRAYLIVDRIGIRVLRDPFTSKPNVLFYTTKRVGGGLVNFEACKLLKVAA